jgi:hypothetical protein
MGIIDDVQPLIEQIRDTTDSDEVIFYAVSFFTSEKNLEELSDDDCIQIIKKLIETNSDAQLAAEIAMVIAEKKRLYSFARKIVSDKSKYTGDDWSLTHFDEKRLEVLTFTTIHDPENCPPEIIMTYDEMIGPDNPVRNGWDNIDLEAPEVQFFKGYYNGEYFEVGRVYEDPDEDDHGETYYNSYYFELESFGGDDENALENIKESINTSSYIWKSEGEIEVDDAVNQVEQLLKLDIPEPGFELLKSINDPKLNQAVSHLIQSVVNKRYFEGKSDQTIINEGLHILHELLPKITNLNIQECFMESLDITNFTELESINLSGCDCLKEIIGLDNLTKLTHLDLSYTPSLELDINDYSHIENRIGLRNKYGMVSGVMKKEYFWDHLWEVIEVRIQELVDDSYDDEEYEERLNDYLGQSIIITIDESDFYDSSFDSSREYFGSLESVLSKEKIECLPKVGKDYQEDEIAVFLFTTNWNFITSFYRHKNDLPTGSE